MTRKAEGAFQRLLFLFPRDFVFGGCKSSPIYFRKKSRQGDPTGSFRRWEKMPNTGFTPLFLLRAYAFSGSASSLPRGSAG